MSSMEDRGLLWQLISEVAALNGRVVVDTGTQTDLARYHTIVPLGLLFITQCLLVCCTHIQCCLLLFCQTCFLFKFNASVI